jgi:regulator of replication initiation timing
MKAYWKVSQQEKYPQVQSDISNLQQKVVKLKHREEELKALFKRLYEDNVLGKIPNEVFRALSQDYLDEQKEVAVAIPEKEQELEKLKSSIANVDLFITKAKQYPEIPELTSEILHLFIDKIVVGEKSERYSRTAFQQVTIYYRDVGLLDLADTQALQRELGVA